MQLTPLLQEGGICLKNLEHLSWTQAIHDAHGVPPNIPSSLFRHVEQLCENALASFNNFSLFFL